MLSPALRMTAASAVLLLAAAASAFAADTPRKASLSAMGGIPINISAWGLDQESFETAVAEIGGRLEYLEAMISTYRPDSDVSRLNRGESLERTPPELSFLAFVANWIASETGGAFDITVKPLVELWQSCAAEQRLPTDAEYQAALAKVGYGGVSVLMDGTISFAQPGIMLDFGGIAKGYFADEAVDILRAAGATRCLVDVGGDIVTWQPDGEAVEPFRAGIRNPRGSGGVFAVISLDGGAVVTSGNYERYYEIDGQRYCHIFDPRSGRPVDGVLSVTLVTKSGIDADAYATAVFVMGPEVGGKFVERNDDLEAVIVFDAGSGGLEVYVSPGLVERFELLEAD